MHKTLGKVPIVLWTDRPWPSRSNLTWKSKFTPFWVCPHHHSPPIQARITKFGPKVQNTLVKFPSFGGLIQGQIWLEKSNFQVSPYWKYLTTIEPWVPRLFQGLTVSQSPPYACAHIPRLFHGPDCFTVSTCWTYIDLGSRGYVGVNVALVRIGGPAYLIHCRLPLLGSHNSFAKIKCSSFIQLTYFSLHHALNTFDNNYQLHLNSMVTHQCSWILLQ